MRCIAVGLVALLPLLSAKAADFVPQAGDILFQDLDGSPLCDAIEAVTQGVDGSHFSHCGIAAFDDDGRPVVVEASGPGVREVRLADFLGRSEDADGHPKVLVGRVDNASIAANGLRRARYLLGVPYDDEFLINNGKYYCSELIHDCYLDGDGRPIFRLFPMTYKEPGRDAFQAAWVAYFNDLGKPIPEGEPGCNPGGLSRSSRVAMVYAYGRPAGYQPGDG